MHIQTSSGNIYSYLRQTNEIVEGIVDEPTVPWIFAPNVQFSSMPNVDSYILGITEQCNLRCTYCCYSGSYLNNRTHGAKYMESKDIDSIFEFIEVLSPNRNIRISFYGGEPLLNYTIIQYAVDLGYMKWGDKVTFSISTNGVLLTPIVIDWIIAKNVELAISIDGTEEFHDKHRIDKRGNGSFPKIKTALLYLKTNYPEYYYGITIMMTLPSFRSIGKIAEAWHNEPLLKELSPSMINGLAPNFSSGVEKIEYEEILSVYSSLLDSYHMHPEWNVLRVLFNQCISYWKERPIVSPHRAVPMATCMPINTKLFVDSNLQIGVCEKISDKYRIGDVKTGINWDKANSIVNEYYNKRVERCRYCPSVRMCDMCLTAVEYTDEQWNVLCHNEQVYTRLFMYLFCEMAERGLIK